MKIVRVGIRNFRGIKLLDWSPPEGPICLVGTGDSGKTTILEAIELALLPRTWVTFVDSDFYGGSTVDPLQVTVTVTDVPAALLTQDKFALDQRGWTAQGELRDEPDDDDRAALTICLRVDDSMEPTWHVVTDRNPDGRNISARDRELLGVSRIGDDVDRQLSWTRGTSLSRSTGDADSLNAAMSEAHRNAREAVAETEFLELTEAAEQAGNWGVRFGAHLDVPLGVGVEPRTLNFGTGALGLRQSGGIPARSAGLGSKRLLALAIQGRATADGAITLVDEVEHGLEPHRLRHLIRELRQTEGQVIMTTHSETAVVEIGCSGLGITRRREEGEVQVLHPSDALQPVIRSLPEAILARRVVVCEGATEWGISRGLVTIWDQTSTQPLATAGAVFVDGGGASAPLRAKALAELGYQCIYWADSDAPVTPSLDELAAAGIEVIVWSESTNSETRIALDIPEEGLPRLWDIAVEHRGPESVRDQLAAELKVEGPRPETWDQWSAAHEDAALRAAVGRVASRSRWFKNVQAGEEVGLLVGTLLVEAAGTDLANKLEELRRAAYGE